MDQKTINKSFALVVKKENLFYFFTLVMILISAFIAAFRGGTYDTTIYKHFFEKNEFSANPVELYNSSGMEYGFAIINLIFLKLGFSYKVLFFFITFLFGYFFIKASDNFSISKFDSFLILLSYYWCLFMLIQMRQGFALSIAYYSLSLFQINKKKFLLFFIFAITIHLSVLYLLIPISLMFYPKLVESRFKLLWVLLLIFLFLYLISRQLQYWGIAKIDYYLNNPLYNNNTSLLSLDKIKSFIIFFLSFFLLDFKNRNHIMLTLIAGLAFVSRYAFSSVEVLAGRFTVSLSIVEIFILPLIFHHYIKNNILRRSLIVLYCIFSLYILLYFKHPHILELYWSKL